MQVFRAFEFTAGIPSAALALHTVSLCKIAELVDGIKNLVIVFKLYQS